MRAVAVVPVKYTSERVGSKNFREFVGGESLFSRKIRQLREADCFNEIYVSTDHVALAEEAESLGFRLIERDASYCNNETPWSEVIYHVVDSLPESDDVVVAWCHTTSPLFQRYSECIERYFVEVREGRSDGLVTVRPMKEFLLSADRRPLNYNWGVWHPYSQQLETIYAVNGALFVTDKATMVKNRYVVSRWPHLFECGFLESIDIDTPEDFTFAKKCLELGLDEY